MSNIQITVETEMAQDVKGQIELGLRAFNHAQVGAFDFHPIVLGARNESGTIVGGVSGGVFLKWLYIESLWVAKENRRLGLGSRLMDEVEDCGRRLNATRSFLDTMGFQAEPFYLRRGYIEFGRISNFVDGFDRIYLFKDLDPGPEKI